MRVLSMVVENQAVKSVTIQSLVEITTRWFVEVRKACGMKDSFQSTKKILAMKWKVIFMVRKIEQKTITHPVRCTSFKIIPR